MRTRHIFTVLSVAIFIACVVVVLSYSSRLTAAQHDGLKAQMQQKIVESLSTIVSLREHVWLTAQTKHEMGVIPRLEVEKAQKKLAEARFRLAAVKQQPDDAMQAFREIVHLHELEQDFVESQAEQGHVEDSEVVETKIRLLEEQVRLAIALRDTLRE